MNSKTNTYQRKSRGLRAWRIVTAVGLSLTLALSGSVFAYGNGKDDEDLGIESPSAINVHDDLPGAPLAAILEETTRGESVYISFSTIRKPSETVPYRVERIEQEGRDGVNTMFFKDFYCGGVLVYSQLLESVTIDPVDQIVLYGTEPTTPYGEFTVPVNGGVLTSRFGPRSASIGASSFHHGIDIGVDYGTPVMAADGGEVISVSYESGYGYYIKIRHQDGLDTLYAHLSSISAKVGQRVARGDIIGKAGDTGNATASCVHFEVWVNGDRVNPLNGYLTEDQIKSQK